MDMKRNLALVISIVMLLCFVFQIAPLAATDSGYTPRVAYANLSYTDQLCMMFAVPIPTSTVDGATVKLLLWKSRDDSLSFSYSDPAKIVLDAGPASVRLDGVGHYIFSYSNIAADDMTAVFCVRPVIVKDDKAIAYGSLVEYSVLEYVKGAKGEIDGVAGLPTDKAAVLETLDYMLDFGAAAQKSFGKDYDYYANDELRSIYVVTDVNGTRGERSLAGFFKHEEGEYVTIASPFVDGMQVDRVFDTSGVELLDVDEYTEGIQINSVDSDLDLVVYYKNIRLKELTGEEIGIGFEVNNYEDGVIGGTPGLVVKSSHAAIIFTGIGSANLSGGASIMDHYGRMNYWNAIKTIQDPTDPDGVVVQMVATNTPAFYFTTEAGSLTGAGIGDTVYPAFTLELELGAVNGKMPSIEKVYFRHRQGDSGVDNEKMVDVELFDIKEGVVTLLSNGETVGKVPETGMKRFAFTIDLLTGKVYAYAGDDSGNMQKVTECDLVLPDVFYLRQEKHIANQTDDIPWNDKTLMSYESIYNYFALSKIETHITFGVNGVNSGTIDGFEAFKSPGGRYNMAEVKALAESDYSFLLDDFAIVAGYVYN